MSQTLLLNSLASVRRRVRVLGLVHGIGYLLASAVGLLLATVLLDYLFNLPPAPRVLIILASLAGIGYVAVNWVARPMLARLRLTDVAGKIEENFPVFNDRLRSAVDFQSGSTIESPAMKQRVVAQATQLAGEVDLQSVVRPAPAWRALGAGVGAIVLAALLAWAIGPDYFGAAMSRLLAPFNDHAWPKRYEIALVGQMPEKVAAGSPVEIRIKLLKGDRPSAKAIVYYRSEQAGQSGPVQQEIMTRNADGTYTASLDAQLDPGKSAGLLSIWMHAGDDDKQLPAVKIVPALTIKDVDAVVTPPKYADLPPTTLDLASAPATVTETSSVKLRVTFSKPIKSIRLEPVGDGAVAPPIQWLPIQNGDVTAAGSFIAAKASRFRVIAQDDDDFSNSGIEEYQILVRPDQLPSVQFEQPIRNLETTADATVPIQGAAEDDFGIKNLELAVRRVADNKTWTIPLIALAKSANEEVAWRKLDSSGDQLRFRVNWDWELAKLDGANFKAGDQLEFYLRVQDNFVDSQGNPHKPPYSESGHLRLTIISQDQLTQQVNDQLSQLRAQVEETRKQNESLRSQTKTLQQDSKDKAAMENADRAVARQLAADQSANAGQTNQIAARLGEILQRLQQNRSANTDAANRVAQAQKLLQDAAENPMKDAAARLAQTADQQQRANASPAQRNANLDQAQRQQEAASNQLQQAMDRLGADTGLSRYLQQVANLLDRQRQLSTQSTQAGKDTLGKNPTELTDQQRQQLNDLARQQRDLARQADDATQQMNKSAQQQERTDPQSSQALKQAADTSQQQNVAGQMNQAAQAQQQNQQANTQQAQSQAELGLTMMLNQLKEAENRRLMELMKQLDNAQQLVGDLLQQQASHNLDNLALQGGNAMAEAAKNSPDLVKDLIDYSGRDATNLPPAAALDTQIALQAQTERNTRNIVSVVQALPEGEDPASDLTRAASRMSRAVAYLQDHRLTDAYQPPQIEAFNALLSAKQTLDKQSQAAQQRAQDQRKETLRQQFVQIREDQAKINDKTKSIDSAAKTDDGQLTHASKANLGILSDQQADLRKRTAKLNDDLAAVGSVAYAYANNDIVARMDRSKTSLSGFDPAAVTQANQTRIVRELDDMIKNLSMRPKQSQFSNTRQGQQQQGQGQGQQQQQAPRLPPEAEVRLIQDLQRLLNEDTKAADPKDKPAVLDLGKRQGDLRSMLDDILKKASEGKTTLGPEPENKATLPEEASDEDLDLQELKDSALNATPDEKGIKDDTGMLGIRMARARQRLALNVDPGTTTQKIQERIVIELDGLGNMAQQQETQAQNSTNRQRQRGQQQQQRQGQQQGNPNNSVTQQNNNPNQRNNPRAPTAGGNTAGLNDQGNDFTIAELKASWGKLSPRERSAIMEGATDQTIQKFKDYVDGYYRTLANKDDKAAQ